MSSPDSLAEVVALSLFLARKRFRGALLEPRTDAAGDQRRGVDLPRAAAEVVAREQEMIDFVRGPTGTGWRDADLTSHPVTLRINGVEVASGHSGMLVFGDPVSGVVWLANHPELGPRGLKAGDVVTTGTCTGITPLSPGDEAEADYGALGTVTARFSG